MKKKETQLNIKETERTTMKTNDKARNKNAKITKKEEHE